MQSMISAFIQHPFKYPSRYIIPLRALGKKTFLSTLNIMVLQMVRNECVRFGGHVDIEVSYKILCLDVLIKVNHNFL
jgi:hypothetical protein